jgi:hypothetical protein
MYPPSGSPVLDGKLCGAACDPAPQSFAFPSSHALSLTLFGKSIAALQHNPAVKRFQTVAKAVIVKKNTAAGGEQAW